MYLGWGMTDSNSNTNTSQFNTRSMKVSIAQMTSAKDVDTNLKVVESLVKQAAKVGSQLLVLPEMFLCLGVKNQSELAEGRFSDNGDVIQTLKGWAKQYSLYLVAGSLPLPIAKQSAHVNQKVYAGCLVFSPQGEVISQYNKMHLFDVDVADEKGSYRESDTFISGDTPKVIEIANQLVGLSICYDLRFPELYQHYREKACRILCVPSAFTYTTGEAHWLTLLKARAVETQCYVLAPNQTGKHEDGRTTYGHSVIIDPWGNTLALKEEGVGIISAELDFEDQDQLRAKMPLSQHKHSFFS